MANDIKNDRATMLKEKIKYAKKVLDGPDVFNSASEEMGHRLARECIKHGEYGLKNLANGKTLESEVKNALKMNREDRQKHYQSVFEEGGIMAVNELRYAVMAERQKTQEIEI